MKKQLGFTLVEIMIVVAIIAMLAAALVPNMVRGRTAANDTAAKATLKSISTALETYMASNSNYPATTTALVTAAPPYISKDYFTTTYNGFNFTPTTLNAGAYVITATPASANQGSTTFTISTGGILKP